MTATLGADIIRASDGSGPVEFPDGIITRNLNGGDISGGIATDADVAASIATHSGEATGVHGVGASTVDSVAARDAAIAAARVEIVVASDGAGDYTTLAAALAALPVDGATIKIKRGTYAGGFTISTANVRLVGEGRGVVTIQAPLSSTVVINVTANDVEISDLSIDGRRDEQSGTGTDTAFAGVNALAVHRTHLQRVRIYDTLGSGFAAGNTANDGIIENCSIENTAIDPINPTTGAHQTGVRLGSGAERWRIINNYITGWAQGIGLWGGIKNTVCAFNRLVNNCGYPDVAHLTPRSAYEDYGAATGNQDNVFCYNYVNGTTGACFELAQGCDGSQVFGNIMRGFGVFSATAPAFVIVDGGALERTKNIIFSYNYVHGDSTHHGSHTLSGYYCEVIGNHFYDFSNALLNAVLDLYDASTVGWTVADNVFDNCVRPIYGGSANPHIIRGNKIFNLPDVNAPAIQSSGGVGWLIEGNIIDCTARAYGIMGIWLVSGSGCRVLNNTILNADQIGIYLWTPDNIVEGNRIITVNAGLTGAIRIYGASALRNVVKHNYISCTYVAPSILIDGGSDYNIVTENRMTGAATITGASYNVTEPNHVNNLTVPYALKSLGAKTVNSTQVTIAHGLGYAPTVVEVLMTSAGTAWKSSASDATNIYLTADADGRTCEVFVR